MPNVVMDARQGLMTAGAKPAKPGPAKTTDRTKLWLGLSYLFLVFGGFVGVHRLYNGQPIMAFAQALFAVSAFMYYGSAVGFYLIIVLVGWLISDAFAIPRWIQRAAA
jgi:TM2 domain-containing membrane protein YozV